MGYQSFGDRAGASRTLQKLEAIQLPQSLRGKAVLDIGCNEGFFCAEAIARGATRVVGVELNETAAAEARLLAPTATILNQSWSHLPDGPFDIVLMLSALHYEQSPRELASRIRSVMAPDGLFILEAGVILDEAPYWKEVVRTTGAVRFPTIGLVRDTILADFAVRLIGPSVPQDGDPLGRQVLHCTPRLPTFFLIPGVSRTGKTVLALDLRKRGIATLSTDEFLIRQSRSDLPTSDRVFNDYLRTLDPEFINVWVDGIDERMAIRVAQYLGNAVPREHDMIALEGYLFSNALVRKHVTKQFEALGGRVWLLERLQGDVEIPFNAS